MEKNIIKVGSNFPSSGTTHLQINLKLLSEMMSFLTKVLTFVKSRDN